MAIQSAMCIGMRKNEVLLDEVVKGGEFRLGEVVFGNRDIGLADQGAAPVGEAEVRLGGIHTAMDDFGGGLASDGPGDFVLNGLEEGEAVLVGGIVVDTCRVDIRDFLVKPPLGSANVLDPPCEFFEVIEGLVGVFQAFVVECETFDDELPESLRGPNAKTGGHCAFDAIADRNDGVEVVEAGRVVLPVGGSSKGILYY